MKADQSENARRRSVISAIFLPISQPTVINNGIETEIWRRNLLPSNPVMRAVLAEALCFIDGIHRAGEIKIAGNISESILIIGLIDRERSDKIK